MLVMELKEYLQNMTGEEREAFAVKCGTTRGHIQNVMYGYKPCATDLAVAIERESKKAVMRWELRADWANHWPELVAKHRKAA